MIFASRLAGTPLNETVEPIVRLVLTQRHGKPSRSEHTLLGEFRAYTRLIATRADGAQVIEFWTIEGFGGDGPPLSQWRVRVAAQQVKNHLRTPLSSLLS